MSRSPTRARVIPDEFVRLLVLSQPIPERLIVDLANALEPPRHWRRRPAPAHMTPLLWETLKLVAAGHTTPRIAEEFGIPLETARDRVKRLLSYFDEPNRMAIVVRCYREGIM